MTSQLVVGDTTVVPYWTTKKTFKKLYEITMSPLYAPFEVMIYTMVTLAITLGLCFDKFGIVNTDDFRCDMSLIYKNYIEFLALRLKGKRDKHVINFQIHFADDVPHLCPCRMLLIWIWYLDLEDGSYIFPSESDLNAHLKKKQRPGKHVFLNPSSTNRFYHRL